MITVELTVDSFLRKILIDKALDDNNKELFAHLIDERNPIIIDNNKSISRENLVKKYFDKYSASFKITENLIQNNFQHFLSTVKTSTVASYIPEMKDMINAFIVKNKNSIRPHVKEFLEIILSDVKYLYYMLIVSNDKYRKSCIMVTSEGILSKYDGGYWKKDPKELLDALIEQGREIFLILG